MTKPRVINDLDEQTRLWVEGESVHWEPPGGRSFKGREIEPDCCPDFSCCIPELLAPEEVRRAFAMAPRRQQGEYLGGFLAAMIAHKEKQGELEPGINVTVVGPGQKDST